MIRKGKERRRRYLLDLSISTFLVWLLKNNKKVRLHQDWAVLRDQKLKVLFIKHLIISKLMRTKFLTQTKNQEILTEHHKWKETKVLKIHHHTNGEIFNNHQWGQVLSISMADCQLMRFHNLIDVDLSGWKETQVAITVEVTPDQDQTQGTMQDRYHQSQMKISQKTWACNTWSLDNQETLEALSVSNPQKTGRNHS